MDFNESLCESTGNGNSENGFDYGIRIILKDKDTNETLNGYANYAMMDNSGGSINRDGGYTCEKNIDEDTQVISAYSQGYSPVVFSIAPARNSLSTIEVSMIKSCTGAPSCFDNFETKYSKLKLENKTYYDELLNEQKNIFYDYVDRSLGVNRTDYTLQCMECDMGRGGYVKAKGIYKDGSNLELYYHWGWCSSGGSDCGYDVCVSTDSDTIFSSAKNNYCNTLYWNARSDENTCPGETFNNDTIIRNECSNGKFDSIDSSKKTFALIQSSNRCSSSVANISNDCLGN